MVRTAYLNRINDSALGRWITSCTYQQMIALLGILLVLNLGVACSATKPATIVAYVNLAVDTAVALAVVIPALGPTVPFLRVAQAGLAGWQPGMPIGANVIAALQSALAQAEQSFPGITPALQAAISILIAAIVAALTIAGKLPAPSSKMKAGRYSGMSANHLREEFNKNAAAAGVKPI